MIELIRMIPQSNPGIVCSFLIAGLLITCLTGLLFQLLWEKLRVWINSAGYCDISCYGAKAVILLYLLPVLFGAFLLKCNTFRLAGELKIATFEGSGFVQLVSIFFAAAWAIGCILKAVKITRSLKNLSLWLKSCIPCDADTLRLFSEICAQMKCSPKKTGLLVHPGIKSALIAGITHPVIVLPGMLTDEKDRRISLMHELTHKRHKDMLFKRLLSILEAVYWFNPKIRKLSEESDDSCEAACDLSVYRLAGGRKNYYLTLYSMLENGADLTGGYAAGTAGNRNQLLWRAVCVKNADKKRRMPACRLAAMLLCLAGIAVGAFSAYCATEGTWRLYHYATDLTTRGEGHEVQPLPQFPEYESFGIAENVVVEYWNEVPADGPYSLTGHFNRSLGANTMALLGPVYAETGEHISLFVSISPLDKPIDAGVLTHSGIKRYVTGSGVYLNYTYNVPVPGFYQLYLENNNGTSVEVSGHYTVW